MSEHDDEIMSGDGAQEQPESTDASASRSADTKSSPTRSANLDGVPTMSDSGPDSPGRPSGDRPQIDGYGILGPPGQGGRGAVCGTDNLNEGQQPGLHAGLLRPQIVPLGEKL